METIDKQQTRGLLSLTKMAWFGLAGVAFVLLGIGMICHENWYRIPLLARALIGLLPWILSTVWILLTLKRHPSAEIAELQGIAAVVGWMLSLHLTSFLIETPSSFAWASFFVMLPLVPLLFLRFSETGFWIWVWHSSIMLALYLIEGTLPESGWMQGAIVLWILAPLGVGFYYFNDARRGTGWVAGIRSWIYAAGIALYCSTLIPTACVHLIEVFGWSRSVMWNSALVAIVVPLLIGAWLERHQPFYRRPLMLMGCAAVLITSQAFSVVVLEDEMPLEVTDFLLITMVVLATLRWTWHHEGKILVWVPVALFLGFVPSLLVWMPFVFGGTLTFEGVRRHDRFLANVAMAYTVLAMLMNVSIYFSDVTLAGVILIICGCTILGVNFTFKHFTKEVTHV